MCSTLDRVSDDVETGKYLFVLAVERYHKKKAELKKLMKRKPRNIKHQRISENRY